MPCQRVNVAPIKLALNKTNQGADQPGHHKPEHTVGGLLLHKLSKSGAEGKHEPDRLRDDGLLRPSALAMYTLMYVAYLRCSSYFYGTYGEALLFISIYIDNQYVIYC